MHYGIFSLSQRELVSVFDVLLEDSLQQNWSMEDQVLYQTLWIIVTQLKFRSN